MAKFKSFRRLVDKQKKKMDTFVQRVQQEAIDIYGKPDNTGFVTGYLRSAFRVANNPGTISSVRTVEEREALGVLQVDTAGLKQRISNIASVGRITYHYNEAFYARDHHDGIGSGPKRFYAVIRNELKEIEKRVGAELIQK